MLIENSESDEEFEVEKVLKKKIVHDRYSNKNHAYYLVHWKGYSQMEATWEPLENLKNALEEVQQFEQNEVKDDEQSVNENGNIPKQKTDILSQENNLHTEQQQHEREGKTPINKKERHLVYEFDHNLEELSTVDFQIVGAMKSDIILYLKLANGKIKAVPSRKLGKKHPQKLIQFYENHIHRKQEKSKL